MLHGGCGDSAESQKEAPREDGSPQKKPQTVISAVIPSLAVFHGWDGFIEAKTVSTGEWGQENRAILLSPFFCRLDQARSVNMVG